MRIVGLFKLILLIFELINFLFIAAIVVFRGINQAGLPEITFAASAALFPLMALFIWLDGPRYKVYIPLFTAGKCIGIFSMLGWSIIAGQVTIGAVLSCASKVEAFLFYGYLFSTVVILLIIRDECLKKDETIGNKRNLEVE